MMVFYQCLCQLDFDLLLLAKLGRELLYPGAPLAEQIILVTLANLYESRDTTFLYV